VNRDLARFENLRFKVSTNSSLSDLGICEMLWYWKNEARIEPAHPPGVPRGLYLGSAMHRFYDLRITEPGGDDMLQSEQAILMATERFAKDVDQFGLEQIDEYNVEVLDLVRAYCSWEQSDDGKKGAIENWATNVRTEVPWIARWNHGGSRVLAGVIDGIGDGTRGPVFFEHKGTGERDLYAFLGRLRADSQILIYAWAIWVITGVAPEGVVYTIYHNKPPKHLRFRKDGKLYAKEVATDRWTFEADLKKAGRTIESLEDYEREYYDQACRNKWVIREFWPISVADIERWRQETDAKLRRMATIRRHPHLAITNRSACRNLWGRDCPYLEKCSGRWVAPDLYQDRKIAPEVEDALQLGRLLRKAIHGKRSTGLRDGEARTPQALVAAPRDAEEEAQRQLGFVEEGDRGLHGEADRGDRVGSAGVAGEGDEADPKDPEAPPDGDGSESW
jgi:L-amino acid N-acyltransferase YncA